MDELAFLPLQSEELTGSTGTRITQYYQLVDDITGRLIAENIASADGLKASSVRESYRRYLRLNGFGCWVTFAPQLWGTYRSTPIWLAVQDPEFKPPARARERLAELEAEDPPRLIDMGNHLAIPLRLPLGAEKAQVVEASLEQVKEIAQPTGADSARNIASHSGQIASGAPGNVTDHLRSLSAAAFGRRRPRR